MTSECNVEGQIQNLFITAENCFGKYCSGKTETGKCAGTKAVNRIRENAVSKLDGSLSTPNFKIFIPCPSDEVLGRTTNFTLPSDNKIPFCIFSPKNSPFSVMKTSKSKLWSSFQVQVFPHSDSVFHIPPAVWRRRRRSTSSPAKCSVTRFNCLLILREWEGGGEEEEVKGCG